MSKVPNQAPTVTCIVFQGPPGQGKSWLAAHWVAYWRTHCPQAPRLIIDTGTASELAKQSLALAGPDRDASLVHWPASDDREGFESWLGDQLQTGCTDSEEWLIWGHSPEAPDKVYQQLMQYGLPRLLHHMAQYCLIDDAPSWMVAALPPEGVLPVWVVSAQAVIEGWTPPPQPWSAHPPCWLINTLRPEDETPEALEALAEAIAIIQANNDRLVYSGRIHYNAHLKSQFASWLADVIGRLPCALG
jgi:hypothetical protein